MPWVVPETIARYVHRAAREAGVSVDQGKVATAVAVAIAEAGDIKAPARGADTMAFNDRNSNGTTDTGLWQINSVHGHSRARLINPLGNAAIMLELSKGMTNWKPWAAYNSGRYLVAMPTGVKAAKGDYGPGAIEDAVDVVTGPGDNFTENVESVRGAFTGLQGILEPAAKLLTRLGDPAFWRRAGVFAAGIVAVAVGLAWLGRRELMDAAGSAAKVIPIGRAASAVGKAAKGARKATT